MSAGYVGMRVRTSCSVCTIATNMVQDCGIRNKGTSPASSEYTQQPEPYGQTRLRSRSKLHRRLLEKLGLFWSDRSRSSITDFLSLRTAKPNLVSLDRLPPVEATRVALPEVGMVMRATAAAPATEGLQPQVADARSSSITSVIPNLTRLLANLHYFD